MSLNNIILQLIKAVVISLIFSLTSILLFAVILSAFSLPNAVIKPVNYLIKSLSVVLGCFFSVKGEKGAIKGFIIGAVIILICYLVFSLTSCNFSLDISLIWDVLLGGVIGAVTGIVLVNKKR